jgi:imidazole glycerol phosphate synthase subunit HisF
MLDDNHQTIGGVNVIFPRLFGQCRTLTGKYDDARPALNLRADIVWNVDAVMDTKIIARQSRRYGEQAFAVGAGITGASDNDRRRAGWWRFFGGGWKPSWVLLSATNTPVGLGNGVGP